MKWYNVDDGEHRVFRDERVRIGGMYELVNTVGRKSTMSTYKYSRRGTTYYETCLKQYSNTNRCFNRSLAQWLQIASDATVTIEYKQGFAESCTNKSLYCDIGHGSRFMLLGYGVCVPVDRPVTHMRMLVDGKYDCFQGMRTLYMNGYEIESLS